MYRRAKAIQRLHTRASYLADAVSRSVPVLAVVALCWFSVPIGPAISFAQDQNSLNKQIKEQKRELDKIQREMNLHRNKSKELREEEQNLLKKNIQPGKRSSAFAEVAPGSAES